VRCRKVDGRWNVFLGGTRSGGLGQFVDVNVLAVLTDALLWIAESSKCDAVAVFLEAAVVENKEE
jgi:hypothetical protein